MDDVITLAQHGLSLDPNRQTASFGHLVLVAKGILTEAARERELARKLHDR